MSFYTYRLMYAKWQRPSFWQGEQEFLNLDILFHLESADGVCVHAVGPQTSGGGGCSGECVEAGSL